ncbi:MAG TPA: carboxypeptidase-like regulatory domain-containing protein, partial [Vicinamibacterales bacterium]|nr:carboxypeptidase-like regulatory domain-containing protein [Vicinamibacterales bacterium]
MRGRNRTRLLLALLTAVACALLAPGRPAFAQSAVLVDGTVRDSEGALLVGAVVILGSPATGASRTTTTDGQGHYQFAGLGPAAEY